MQQAITWTTRLRSGGVLQVAGTCACSLTGEPSIDTIAGVGGVLYDIMTEPEIQCCSFPSEIAGADLW